MKILRYGEGEDENIDTFGCVVLPVSFDNCDEFNHIKNFNQLVFRLRYYIPQRQKGTKSKTLLSVCDSPGFSALKTGDIDKLRDLVQKNQKDLVQQLDNHNRYRMNFVTGIW
ncbi:hypothetical protein [Priestia aryabhattai]|uniref:hypothetical protein n=1 Tax=Priestia aryabhattai TaxID=412384 RepID=UPI003D2A0558